MSGLWSWLGASESNVTLPEIFPVPIQKSVFVSIDVRNIFKRILTDCLERTSGLSEDEKNLLSDSCVGGSSPDGLVTLISNAMSTKSELFIVYDRTVKVIRKADAREQEQIKNDYKARAESAVGIYITFQNYDLSDMVNFYSALKYYSVGGLYKSMNVSKALQIKINDLRASTGLADSANAKKQAKEIAEALRDGKDIFTDAKDLIQSTTPDVTATNSALDMIASNLSFYLGLPASWVTGVLSGGMGDKSSADMKAVERGLKPYFSSIIKPVMKAIFGKTVSFQSLDFQLITGANETLKTFDLTSDDHISKENKTKITNRLFGLPEDAEGDPPEKNPSGYTFPDGKGTGDPKPSNNFTSKK